jgi:hypothetical protein
MKRLVAAALWLYSFWYLGSMIAAIVGVPDLLGPALGLAAGVIVGIDPRRLIWTRQTARRTASPPAAAPNAA